jgi:hypothetical protein
VLLADCTCVLHGRQRSTQNRIMLGKFIHKTISRAPLSPRSFAQYSRLSTGVKRNVIYAFKSYD